VRTLLEKQKQERVLQRQERAERRARRTSENDENSAPDEEEEDQEECEGEVEDGIDRDADGQPLRHRRGPGDEEDYVTPDRPERPVKRTRLDEGDEGEMREGKRVKWDRGLTKTVYLDDSPPKPTRPSEVTVILGKGCLTPAAKALRLDNMGNLLEANVPVGGLVTENIVVKKFVYEDDPVADPEPEPEPEPVPKATRSRSKKAKS